MAALMADRVHGFLTIEPIYDEAGAIEDFVLTGANAAAERLLTFDGEKSCGRPLRSVFPKIRQTDHIETYRDVVAHQEALSFKIHRPPEFGGTWLLAHASPMEGGVLITLSEATEAERWRDQAREQRSVLRLLLDELPVPIVMLDTELRIIFATQTWISTYWPKSAPEVFGHGLYDVFPRLPERWRKAHRRGLAGEVVRERQDYVVWEDGRPIWLDWSVHPWWREDGSIGGIIVITEDISERRKVEIAYAQITERLELASQAANEGIWDWDLAKGVVHCNRRFALLCGLPPETMCFEGSRLAEIVHAEDLEQIQTMVVGRLQSGDERFEILHRIALPGKAERWIRNCGRVVERNTEGRALRMVGTASDVTDRKAMQSAIERQNEKLTGLAASLPGMTVIVDGEGYIDEIIREQHNLQSGPAEGAGPQTLCEIWPAETVDAVRALLAEAESGNCPAQGRIEISHSSGRRWMECHAAPMRGETGGRYVLLAIDITEAVEAEEMRARFMDASPDMLCFGRREGPFTRMSEACRTILGWSPEEMTTRPFLEFVHPEDRGATAGYVSTLDSNGMQSGFRNRYLCKDGSYRWIQWTVAGLGQGEDFLIGRDVTAEKEAQARIEASEARFRELFNNAMTGRCIFAGQAVIKANATLARFFGVANVEELEATPDIRTFMAPETGNALEEVWADFQAGRSDGVRGRYRFLGHGGQEIWCDVLCRRIEWKGGIAAEATLVDVTAEVKYEEDLVSAREAALSAVKAKSEFLATVSHEIRTPLNAIIGMTKLLRETELSSEQDLFANHTQSAGEHLLRLVNDILDFTKLEANRMLLDESEFDPVAEIRSVCETLESAGEKTPVTLRIEVSDRAHTRIVADAARVRQLLFNIVGNALKFTEAGSVTVEADIVPAMDEEYADLIMTVRDTGIGIPAEKVPTLFTRFTQVDSSAARRYGGTGLGLAISKRICELMGGSIRVESELGKGSCFRIELPVTFAEGAVPEPRAEESVPALPQAEGLDILVADDNAANRLLVETILKRFGYRVTLVADGEAAVDAANAQAYALILMDIQMPKFDGTEALHRIRGGTGPNAGTPIIALTAHADERDADRFLKAGFAAMVAKPLKVADLAAVIERETARGAPDAGRGAA